MITDTSKLYDDDDELWIKNFLEYIEHDDGVAAKESLMKGVSIYYAEPDTPENCVIKEYPDGRKELVSFMTGKEIPVPPDLEVDDSTYRTGFFL